MIFTNATEYAIRGLAELVSRSDGRNVLLENIVDGTGLPRQFMAKIFQKLVRAGMLISSKGRGGGFSLARPANQITLMQIVEAMEGTQLTERCIVGFEQCSDTMPCPQHDSYKPVRQRLKDYLNHTSLLDLASSLKAKTSWREARVKGVA